MNSNGLVLTVASLVGKLSTAMVTLDDKRSFEATVWGLDEVRNMAVLRIQATGLPAATFGDSSKLSLGQSVLVVGYDSGDRSPSPRLGTVRGFRTSTTTGLEYIETDAAAGQGSQGAPMVNSKGEVVGLFMSPSPFTISGVTHAASSQTMSTYLDKLKRGAKFYKATPFASFPKKEGSFPPIAGAYFGTVTVDGKPAASGAQVVAVVGDFVSEPAVVSAGNYSNLAVGPPYSTYDGMRITFYVDGFAATETKVFRSGDYVAVNLTVTTPSPP